MCCCDDAAKVTMATRAHRDRDGDVDQDDGGGDDVHDGGDDVDKDGDDGNGETLANMATDW